MNEGMRFDVSLDVTRQRNRAEDIVRVCIIRSKSCSCDKTQRSAERSGEIQKLRDRFAGSKTFSRGFPATKAGKTYRSIAEQTDRRKNEDGTAAKKRGARERETERERKREKQEERERLVSAAFAVTQSWRIDGQARGGSENFCSRSWDFH